MNRPARASAPPAPVLVVEADVADQVVLRQTLLEGGWAGDDICVVASLSEARDVLIDRPFGAILVDLTLEDASGLTAVAVLTTAAPDVPVVVVSAHRGEPTVLAALAEGADEFVSRDDVGADAVVSAIGRATERRRDRRARIQGLVGPAIQGLDAAAAVLDGTGHILAVNDAWMAAADAGGAPHDAVGPGVSYLSTCDVAVGRCRGGAAEASRGIRDVLAGRADHFSLDYPCADGAEERWFALRVSPLGPMGGGAVVTHLDITPVKAVEANLRRNGQRLAGVVDDSFPIFAVLDEAAVVRQVSPSTRHLLGLDPGDAVGGDALERIAPADLGKAKRTLQAALAQPGLTQRIELRALDGGGRWRDLDLAVVNLLDDERVGGIVVVGSDRTAGRLAQIAGRLESRLLQRLPAAVVVTDDRDVIVYWNARAEEMFDLAAADVVGRPAYAVALGPELRDPARRVKASVLAGGRWEGAIEARRADGSMIPVYTTLEAVTDPEIGFRGIVSASIDNTERRRLESDIAFAALHDRLTGLPNRRLLVDHLESSVARSARTGSSTAVHSIDLDEFKEINDALGHEAGDAILRAVAERLAGVVRQGDLVARIGGDEFIVCSEGVSCPGDAVALGRRVLEVLAEPVPIEGGSPIGVSASIGVALSGPGGHAEVLIRNATAAMATAKEAGRARVELFDDEVHAQASRRHRLAMELARGIEGGQLEVHYQPQIAVASGALAGFEALVRWRHPERGLVAPEDFIGVAEESGLVGALGDHVLRHACAQLSRWLELAPDAALEVAVNVSGRQLAEPDFPSRVRSVITEAQVPAGRVCLEVTETALLDADAAERSLRALKEVGVSIAIDDFGTGYSSLHRLKRFPVDYLKIDRSFVQGIGTDPEDDVIVGAVVNLAHSLGLQVVAEGIEAAEQLQRLAALGCELGQGYLWHRPADAVTADALVAARCGGWQVPSSLEGAELSVPPAAEDLG